MAMCWQVISFFWLLLFWLHDVTTVILLNCEVFDNNCSKNDTFDCCPPNLAFNCWIWEASIFLNNGSGWNTTNYTAHLSNQADTTRHFTTSSYCMISTCLVLQCWTLQYKDTSTKCNRMWKAIKTLQFLTADAR